MTVRTHSIEDTQPDHSFSVCARAIATGADASTVPSAIGSAFWPIEGRFYGIDTTVRENDEHVEAITDRLEHSAVHEEQSLTSRLTARLPSTSNRDDEIVTALLIAPNLCLFDGASLSQTGQRALQATPEERTNTPPLRRKCPHPVRVGHAAWLSADEGRLDRQQRRLVATVATVQSWEHVSDEFSHSE